MKSKSSWFVVVFVVGLAIISLGLYQGGLAFFSHYEATQPQALPTVQCSRLGTVHQVNISNGVIIPLNTRGKLCDQLTITNHDNVLRLLAFGPHEHHVPYDGVTERVLDQNQSLTITLNQAGNFTFHDHLHDTVIGTFTVR